MEEIIARQSIKRFEAQFQSSSDNNQKPEIGALLQAERQGLHEARQGMIGTEHCG